MRQKSKKILNTHVLSQKKAFFTNKKGDKSRKMPFLEKKKRIMLSVWDNFFNFAHGKVKRKILSL